MEGLTTDACRAGGGGGGRPIGLVGVRCSCSGAIESSDISGADCVKEGGASSSITVAGIDSCIMGWDSFCIMGCDSCIIGSSAASICDSMGSSMLLDSSIIGCSACAGSAIISSSCTDSCIASVEVVIGCASIIGVSDIEGPMAAGEGSADTSAFVGLGLGLTGGGAFFFGAPAREMRGGTTNVPQSNQWRGAFILQ